MAAQDLAERKKALTAGIAAARAELSRQEQFEGADIGGLLEALNGEVEELAEGDDEAALPRYDDLEKRLDEVRTQLKG